MKKSVVIAALGAPAQETRFDIFRLLIQKGPEGMPAGATLAIPARHEHAKSGRILQKN
jgi:hypothetical protein